MKAMTKSELADAAGVSVTTLMNWCKPYRDELEAMGLRLNMRVVPPIAVKWIAEKFCIDVE
jgi:DNA-binding XRE family transcriptional regulator